MTLEAAANSRPPDDARKAKRSARRVLRGVLQLAITGGLGLYALSLVDTAALRLDALNFTWLGVALLTSVPQYVASAARWCFTARRLGVRLSFGAALREYYVGSFANLTLPSGMAGEALRVVRHGARLGREREGFVSSLRVVILERLAGQITLWACVILSMPLWLGARHLGRAALVLAVCACVGAGLVWFVRARMTGWLRSHYEDAQRALLVGDAWPTQLGTSLVTIVSSVVLFACCAQAVSAPLGLGSLLRIGPLVLASMTLPLSIGGWGVRELATSALYAASGLDPATGAATSVLYGLVSLAGSLPGAVMALWWRAEE